MSVTARERMRGPIYPMLTEKKSLWGRLFWL